MPLLEKTFLIIAATLFCLPQFVLAVNHEYLEHNSKSHDEQNHHERMPSPQGIQLSSDLHTLLNKEMGLIQKAMMDMVPAIASGEWDKVSSIGQKIKASFILKQKLTKVQKEELQRVLPEQFIEMDIDFHKSAGMLSHAAEMKNADVVNFYFYKMNAACVSCHGKYAAGRFPGLGHDENRDHH